MALKAEELEGAAPQGLLLAGEYLGLRVAPEKVKNGKTYQNVDAGLRVNGIVEAVNYPSRASAEAAVGGTPVGEWCALPVEVRRGVTNGRPWEFYAGARSGGTWGAEDFRP